MSLRKKIIIGFSISAVIITILAAFELVNFIQVRNEMRFLEVTATVRNNALELRRHEKNYFLFPDKAADESNAAWDYYLQLEQITTANRSSDPGRIEPLMEMLSNYGTTFSSIQDTLPQVTQDFEKRKGEFGPYQSFVPLMEADARDKPLQLAQFLQSNLGFPATDPLVVELKQLDSDITSLRDSGENIVAASDDLDTDARNGADSGISRSQTAILIFFPLFLVFGLGALLYINNSVVRRLNTLTQQIDRIGQRYAHGEPQPREKNGHRDEVDTLINKFNNMNDQLIDWEQELDEKNRELLQSKKLAAIGTLASGVAHELNNPLNNINISAQMLKKQLDAEKSAAVIEIVDDIVGQTARVKDIVGNLLEFAKEREPRLRRLDLAELIRHAYRLVSGTVGASGVRFQVHPQSGSFPMQADPDQLERVFVNLFSNAIAAMDGSGDLTVRIESENGEMHISVSDTGSGISEEDRENIFDPFFTRKDKGTGLGLAIVMNIIQKHGGHIHVLSEEGIGTIFDILLPKGEI